MRSLLMECPCFRALVTRHGRQGYQQLTRETINTTALIILLGKKCYDCIFSNKLLLPGTNSKQHAEFFFQLAHNEEAGKSNNFLSSLHKIRSKQIHGHVQEN